MVALSLLIIGSEIKLDGLDYRDLAPLESALKGVSLVQIGEATHGGAEFYRLKTRLVRFLHEKMGFDLLLMESGILECALAERKRGKELMEATIFQNFRWKESLPLFEYLVANPKLDYKGFDVQFSSDEVLNSVAAFLKPYDAELALSVSTHLGDGYKLFGLASKPDEFSKVQKTYLTWLKETRVRIASLTVEKKVEWKRDLVAKTMDLHGAYWNFPADQLNSMARLQLRDELMSQAAEWFLPKGRKAIIWTHNGHVGENNFYRTMGSRLAATRKEKSYTLGISARDGTYYEHWSRSVKPWAAKAGGFEVQVNPKSDAVFIDFRRVAKPFDTPMAMFEPENGGNFDFVPSQRFDGAIVIRRVSPPTKLD